MQGDGNGEQLRLWPSAVEISRTGNVSDISKCQLAYLTGCPEEYLDELVVSKAWEDVTGVSAEAHRAQRLRFIADMMKMPLSETLPVLYQAMWNHVMTRRSGAPKRKPPVSISEYRRKALR